MSGSHRCFDYGPEYGEGITKIPCAVKGLAAAFLIFGDFPVEGGPGDAQDLGGEGHVVVGSLQGFLDHFSAHSPHNFQFDRLWVVNVSSQNVLDNIEVP